MSYKNEILVFTKKKKELQFSQKRSSAFQLNSFEIHSGAWFVCIFYFVSGRGASPRSRVYVVSIIQRIIITHEREGGKPVWRATKARDPFAFVL